jgi:Transglutaminase-like superfamily
MRLVSKFFLLDRVSRKLLLIASFLVILFWFLLRILSFQVAYSIMERLAVNESVPHPDNPEIVSRITWALSIASRRILGKDTCLPQAMAARIMFNRFGYPAEIRFGVKKSVGGKLQAHAWVFNGDEILIGGEGLDLASYTPLNYLNRSML